MTIDFTKNYGQCFNEEMKDAFMEQLIPGKTILWISIGYNMVIPQFYLVLKKTKRTITLIKLATKNTSDDGYGQAGYCVPIQSYANQAEPFRKRITQSGIVIQNCPASIWDGSPKQFDYYD